MDIARQLDDLAKLDFVIDCKAALAVSLERLPEGQSRAYVVQTHVKALTKALRDAEKDGELSPGESETLLALGIKALESET